ncbi:hypothetical protein [Sedimentitalea xiamensis]|nr:hypothetical protein [Sedimentitalea xiamensis]
MNFLPNPLEVQAACIRMAGHAVSNNIRIMQIVTRSALQAPYIPIRALRAGAVATSKPASRTVVAPAVKAAPKPVTERGAVKPEAKRVVRTPSSAAKAATAATPAAKSAEKPETKPAPKPVAKKATVTPVARKAAPKKEAPAKTAKAAPVQTGGKAAAKPARRAAAKPAAPAEVAKTAPVQKTEAGVRPSTVAAVKAADAPVNPSPVAASPEPAKQTTAQASVSAKSKREPSMPPAMPAAAVPFEKSGTETDKK